MTGAELLHYLHYLVSSHTSFLLAKDILHSWLLNLWNCRNIVQALYAPGRDASALILRKPGVFHRSLSCLHAWRYTQLLELLPKRSAESLRWKLQAQQQADAFLFPNLENSLGAITLFKNEGPKGTGVFVDNSCRFAMPCLRSLVSGRRANADEYSS